MDLKKKMKAFFTFKRRANDGFTLVELIVVIAILAILGGVAVPAYGGYVTKANKGADMSLISEVEQALVLAYYDGTIEETGVVVLSTTGANVQGTGVDNALMSVFGDGYAEQLQLKYDGWKGGVGSVYASFKESGFYGNQDALMGDIQDLTNAVETFLGVKENAEFVNLMPGWKEFQDKYGVVEGDTNAMANSTALYVAETTKNKVATDADKKAFINAWTKVNSVHTVTRHDITFSDFNDVGMGTLSNMAAHYARAEALADYIDSLPAGTYNLNIAPYTSMKEWFADNGNVSGATSKEVVQNMETVTKNFATAMGSEYQTILGNYLKSAQAQKDAVAYLDMMGAINDHSDQLAENLDQESLYEGGAAHELLNGYLAAGAAMESFSVDEGCVGVVIAAGNNGYVLSVVGAN